MSDHRCLSSMDSIVHTVHSTGIGTLHARPKTLQCFSTVIRRAYSTFFVCYSTEIAWYISTVICMLYARPKTMF